MGEKRQKRKVLEATSEKKEGGGGQAQVAGRRTGDGQTSVNREIRGSCHQATSTNWVRATSTRLNPGNRCKACSGGHSRLSRDRLHLDSNSDYGPPRWLSGKEPAPPKAGDSGLMPGSGRSPGEGNATCSNILAWATVHVAARESDTTLVTNQQQQFQL